MKKTIALVLLTLVCSLSCMLPVRYGMKQAAKAIMNNRLNEGEVYVLSVFSAAELAGASWEDEREFRFNGRLYDVVSVKYEHGVKNYYCATDELERRVEQKADEAVASRVGHERNNSLDNQARAVIDWLQNLYFQHFPGFGICAAPDDRVEFFTITGKACPDAFVSLPAIPPEA